MSNILKKRLIKRLITGALVLILVFSINGFASVVSDNDGSAFITKAEFDSLKNNFQSQIDQYNQSIDSKIDGAIAAYLAGLQLVVVEHRATYAYDSTPIKMMDNNNPLRYALGYSWVVGFTGQIIYNESKTMVQSRSMNVVGHQNYWNATNPKPFKKLLITQLNPNSSTAEWVGYGTDCREQLVLNPALSWSGFNQFSHPTDDGKVTLNGTNRQDTEWNQKSANLTGLTGYYWWLFGDYNASLIGKSLAVSSDGKMYQNLCLFKDDDALELQEDGVVHGTATMINVSTLNANNEKLKSIGSEVILNETQMISWHSNCMNGNLASFENRTGSMSKYNQAVIWMESGLTGDCAPPVQCFESRGGLDKWSKLYKSKFDDLATYYSTLGGTLPNAVISETIDGIVKYHMAMTAGLPIIDVKRDEKCKFTFTVNNEDDLPMYVWMKTMPFDKIVSPASESDKSDFLILAGDNSATFDETSKALKITANNTTISFAIPENKDECYAWMKWAKAKTSTGIDITPENATGGAEIIMPKFVDVQLADN